MNSLKFYKLPPAEKEAIFNKISENTGVPPYAVEKDWWVVQVLTIIFEMEIGQHLVFKGGTSLSKAWGLIERFSEDIDLALDRKFLGFDGELSKNQRTKLRKESKKYISETFYPELQECFKKKGFTDLEFIIEETTISDKDPNIIGVKYQNVIEHPGYILPPVQIEVGCRSLREPFSEQPILSLVDEHFPNEDFINDIIKVPTVIPERTFLEKIFLLHEEFKKPLENIRVDRLSRHLYDIHQILKTKIAEKAIADKDLYETIVKHRYQFTRIGGVDYNLHQPQTINPIPIPEIIDKWKSDYSTMQEQMIHGDSPSFDELLISIKEFVSKINQLDWKMDVEFDLNPTSHNNF